MGRKKNAPQEALSSNPEEAFWQSAFGKYAEAQRFYLVWDSIISRAIKFKPQEIILFNPQIAVNGEQVNHDSPEGIAASMKKSLLLFIVRLRKGMMDKDGSFFRNLADVIEHGETNTEAPPPEADLIGMTLASITMGWLQEKPPTFAEIKQLLKLYFQLHKQSIKIDDWACFDKTDREVGPFF